LIAAIALMAWLSAQQIDGQTGDVLGALEQLSEILVLLVAAA
jgi:adenosylcobinamide-GDP ribazoletransferase